MSTKIDEGELLVSIVSRCLAPLALKLRCHDDWVILVGIEVRCTFSINGVEVSHSLVEYWWDYDAIWYMPESMTSIFDLICNGGCTIIYCSCLECTIESEEFEGASVAESD